MTVKATAIAIVGGAGAVYALREGGAFAAPLLVSVLLAYAMEPAVALLMRGRLPRGAAVVGVYALLAGAALVTGRFAQRQVVAFVEALPASVADLQRSLSRPASGAAGPGAIEHLQHAATDIAATLGGAAPPPAPGTARVMPVAAPFSLRAYLANASASIAATGAQLGAIAILTFLLLLTGESLKRRLIGMAGPRLASKKLTYDVIKAIDRQIERYLVARALISAIVAAATWLGLAVVGVREPLALGLMAGALNVVPFVGPAVAVGLIAVVAFLQFHAVEPTAAAVLVSGTIAALEGNLISPWLTSRAGELNTVAVFVSVLFWGWLWDVWGLVVAIPIMVAIKAAADHYEPLQPLGELLGR